MQGKSVREPKASDQRQLHPARASRRQAVCQDDRQSSEGEESPRGARPAFVISRGPARTRRQSDLPATNPTGASRMCRSTERWARDPRPADGWSFDTPERPVGPMVAPTPGPTRAERGSGGAVRPSGEKSRAHEKAEITRVSAVIPANTQERAKGLEPSTSSLGS